MRGRVRVPDPAPEFSTGRVLAMEWIDGAPVTDRAGVVAAGVRPSDVAWLVAETFAEMIFLHGHVHCDPHGGNLLVRRVGGGGGGGGGSRGGASVDHAGPVATAAALPHQPRVSRGAVTDGRVGPAELILLDHGLYRPLDDGFRLAYARMWRALIAGDVPGIYAAAAEMGTDAGTAPLFASLISMKPWAAISGARGGSSRSGAARLRVDAADRAEAKAYAADHAPDISRLLGRLPRPLLLLLKTNDCLRSIDCTLGTPANTFVVTARECARALAVDARQRARDGRGRGGEGAAARGGLRAALGATVAAVRAELTVAAVRLAAWGWPDAAARGGGGE